MRKTFETWQIGKVTWLLFFSFILTKIVHKSNAFQNQNFYQQFIFAPNDVCISPKYFVDSSTQQVFTMRNVPGEGDCMFLATALAAAASMGLGANGVLLRKLAKETREVVADILEFGQNSTLAIDSKHGVTAKKLLSAAAKEEGMRPEEYLRRLRLEGSQGGMVSVYETQDWFLFFTCLRAHRFHFQYGGGHELAILSNVLRRPISVYELLPTMTIAPKYHPVQCKGVFGDKIFKDPCLALPNSAILSKNNQRPGAYSWHLHILVLDSSEDGEKHACVLLPQ